MTDHQYNRVAVVGSNGYVGSCIAAWIKSNNDCQHSLVEINRSNNIPEIYVGCELVIIAANSAQRYKANSNPEMDYENTVLNTKKILHYSRNASKILLVSSLSCRTQLDTYYGLHRRICELMVADDKGTVVRLGPMYGGNRTTDTLHDIINGNRVYLSEETRYAYVDVRWAASMVVELAYKQPNLYEIGARNVITLKHIANHVGSSSIFNGHDDSQYPTPNYAFDAPDAFKVLDFCDQLRLSKCLNTTAL